MILARLKFSIKIHTCTHLLCLLLVTALLSNLFPAKTSRGVLAISLIEIERGLSTCFENNSTTIADCDISRYSDRAIVFHVTTELSESTLLICRNMPKFWWIPSQKQVSNATLCVFRFLVPCVPNSKGAKNARVALGASPTSQYHGTLRFSVYFELAKKDASAELLPSCVACLCGSQGVLFVSA